MTAPKLRQAEKDMYLLLVHQSTQNLHEEIKDTNNTIQHLRESLTHAEIRVRVARRIIAEREDPYFANHPQKPSLGDA